jgi:class 3 adenylate cyclase
MNESKWGKRLSSILAADVVGYTRLMEQDSDGTVAYWQGYCQVNCFEGQ